jgi:hypothetical protein
MNIDWAIPCRFVEVHDNLGTIIGAGIDTVAVAELPTPIQILLAVRLVGLNEEFTADQQHQATNRVRDPTDEVISEVRGEFVIGAESSRADWLAGVIVPVGVQFPAAEEGTYTIELTMDDASTSLPLHVVASGAPPAAEA